MAAVGLGEGPATYHGCRRTEREFADARAASGRGALPRGSVRWRATVVELRERRARPFLGQLTCTVRRQISEQQSGLPRETVSVLKVSLSAVSRSSPIWSSGSTLQGVQ